MKNVKRTSPLEASRIVEDCLVKWTHTKNRSRRHEDPLLAWYFRRPIRNPGILISEFLVGRASDVDKSPVRLSESAKARQIDAVRIVLADDYSVKSGLYSRKKHCFQRLMDVLTEHEKGIREIEVIEVKPSLNRTSIGQVMVAAWFLQKSFSFRVHVRKTIVVSDVDEGLLHFCFAHGITVSRRI